MDLEPLPFQYKKKYGRLSRLMRFCVLALIFCVSLTSCYSVKKYAYFQDLMKDTAKMSVKIKEKDFLLKIQPDDILSIDVVSSNPAAAVPFNLNNMTSISGYNNANNEAIAIKSATPPSAAISFKATNGYLVDRNGNIEMPLIGSIYVKDMTIPHLKDTLTGLLRSKYIKDAIVNAQISNAGALYMGEAGGHVTRVPLQSEKTSILDGLALSGDLTDVADRKNVLLIREHDGVKHVYRIDLSNSDFFASDQYYLQQNDIVYVPPRKEVNMVRDNLTFRLFSYFFSAISVVSLILALQK